MVDIFVGAEQKKYHLHRDLICDRSDYFSACFTGNFKEAQQKELSLPEVDVEAFDLCVSWLYGVPSKKIGSDNDLPAHLSLYVLANKLCLEYLQNETMDHILRFHRTTCPVHIDYQHLRYLYRNTSDREPIRHYAVNLAAWTTVWEEVVGLTPEYQRLIRKGGDLAVDFADYMTKFYAHSRGGYLEAMDPRRVSNCSYHRHQNTPDCSESSE